MREGFSATPQAPAAVSGWTVHRSNATQFLERLTSGLIRAATLDEIANFVVDLVLKDTPAESCWVAVSGSRPDELKTVMARSPSGAPPDLNPRFESWVAANRTPLHFGHVGDESQEGFEFNLCSEVSSLLCLPLMASNRVVGVLTLGSPVPDAFSQPTRRNLSRAADQIAAALERAHRVESMRSINDAVISGQLSEYRKRLAHAEKMSSLGELLAGIVHELNNPLTTIIGFSELLARSARDRKSLDTIISECQRCARIVQSVLHIARSGPGERETIDLNSAIREIVELVSYQSRLSRVTIGVNLTAAAPRVEVNSGQLTQVLLNLVTNAVQAMNDSSTEGSHLSISTAVEGNRAVIRVEDDGPGIAPDVQARIFDPFFTTKGGGTGLGLSLSRDMIQDHGGTIGVRSVPGEGSTFRVELPLADAEDDSAETTDEFRRVLVVDDEQHILDLVEAVLEGKDLAIERANSGHEGIRKLREKEYHLVISDYRMPGIGGREIVEWVRENKKKTRVLVLSGDILSRDFREFAATAPVTCLPKPFRVEELVSSVENALAGDAVEKAG